MAHAVPGPGGEPDAKQDWFAEFAEEEPQTGPAPPDLELHRVGPERAPSDSRLIDPSTAIDDWSTASATPMPEALAARSNWFALNRSRDDRRHGRVMRLVALAAGVVALAAWWFVPRLGGDVTLPEVPPQAAPSPAPPPPAPPPIDPAPAPVTAAPVTSAPAPDAPKPTARQDRTPPPVTPATARVSAAPAAAPLPPAATPEAIAARAAETPAIEATLGRYRAAFGALDAGRVVDVWPAADRASLERTFDGLSFQALEFEQCAIDVRDRDAQALCRGRARVVTKAATKTFVEPRRWEFTLRRDDRGWVIREVRAGK